MDHANQSHNGTMGIKIPCRTNSASPNQQEVLKADRPHLRYYPCLHKVLISIYFSIANNMRKHQCTPRQTDPTTFTSRAHSLLFEQRLPTGEQIIDQVYKEESKTLNVAGCVADDKILH